ncbi:MAG: hypothetical protein AB8F78_17405 [Saprospiraceae bacterium]
MSSVHKHTAPPGFTDSLLDALGILQSAGAGVTSAAERRKRSALRKTSADLLDSTISMYSDWLNDSGTAARPYLETAAHLIRADYPKHGVRPASETMAETAIHCALTVANWEHKRKAKTFNGSLVRRHRKTLTAAGIRKMVNAIHPTLQMARTTEARALRACIETAPQLHGISDALHVLEDWKPAAESSSGKATPVLDALGKFREVGASAYTDSYPGQCATHLQSAVVHLLKAYQLNPKSIAPFCMNVSPMLNDAREVLMNTREVEKEKQVQALSKVQHLENIVAHLNEWAAALDTSTSSKKRA